jgi:general secretion pathway protein F
MTRARTLSVTQFSYRAFTPLGELKEGVVEAQSQEQATDLVWGRGLTPLSVARSTADDRTPWWKRDVAFAAKRPSARAVCDFTRKCATLNQAGIPLDDTLRLVADQTAAAPMRRVCHSILAAVLDGAPLADALARHRDVFPPDYINIVRAGETGGYLGQVLGELASLLEQRVELQGRVRSALIYPAVLVVFALASIGIIMNVLIPNVAPIFAQNRKPIPALIGGVVALQSHWRLVGFVMFLAAIAASVGCLILVRSPTTRRVVDRFIIRTPYLGGILLERETARFARTLGTLLRSGVPMIAAFGSARDVVANRFLVGGLDASLADLQDGHSLASALTKHSGLPKPSLQMIAIGEESGRLGSMLIRLADNAEQQTQRQVNDAMSLLSPGLTMLIAGIIGTLIFTIMNAILSINELAIQ